MPSLNDAAATQILIEAIRNEELSPEIRERARKLLTIRTEDSIKSVEEQVRLKLMAAKQRGMAAKEAEDARKALQKRCSHMKQNPVTGATFSHCRGQQMADGRLVIICQECAKIFSDPPNPKEGWDDLSENMNLIPDSGGIGSVMDPRSMLEARRKIAAEIRDELAQRDRIEAEAADELEKSLAGTFTTEETI